MSAPRKDRCKYGHLLRHPDGRLALNAYKRPDRNGSVQCRRCKAMRNVTNPDGSTRAVLWKYDKTQGRMRAHIRY